LKFNPLDIRDMEAEKNVLVGYMEKGVVTINEVRKKAGLGPPVPGGDRAFILMGNTIMFVDEMTEAMGTEREELEAQIEETKNALNQKAAEAAAQAATERRMVGAGDVGGGNSGGGNKSTPDRVDSQAK
jgi:hypothetical protein